MWPGDVGWYAVCDCAISWSYSLDELSVWFDTVNLGRLIEYVNMVNTSQYYYPLNFFQSIQCISNAELGDISHCVA